MFLLQNLLCFPLLVCLASAAEVRTRAAASTDDIHFLLYTRSSGVSGNWTELDLTTDSLLHNGINPDLQTVIVCHGFTSNGFEFGEDFGDAYSQAGQFNVISIDWEELAKAPNYPQAASNTRLVGDHAAKLVHLLHQLGDISNLHLVGHSLGAHVVGFIGRNFSQSGGFKLPRITGLDPARPGFVDFGIIDFIDGLNREDAQLVDVIHTNSGLLHEGCLSIFESIGHMDFYPNGGRHQPGCKDLCFLDSCEETFKTVDTQQRINAFFSSGFCSHSRAVKYFVESIQALPYNTKFNSWWCPSWESFNDGSCCSVEPVSMGHHLSRNMDGAYMLTVGEQSPFSVEQNDLACQTK